MSGTNGRSDHAAQLRRQAEEIARDNAAKSPKHVEALSPQETQYMLHELQVHQIELEMQNEELRKAQVELDAGRARYFDLYDLAPVGYVTVSEQGLLLEVNLTTATLLGVTRNELIKQPFSRFVLREDQDIYYFLHKQLVETGEPHDCELRMVKKDGSAFWVRLQATSVQDAAGLAVSRAVIGDITDRKQAEAEKEALQAQLHQSQKMDAIGQLAGGVAHDFNNLLTGILGNIALMRSNLPPGDPLLDNLNGAETAARQAADLTKGLLTFSHSAVVLPVPMNVTAALDATAVLLKQSLPATMEIVRDEEQPAWNVLLDQSQMTQILLDLAVNARDAMKGAGTLTIQTRNEVLAPDYVQSHPFARTGEFVHLSISDTGPGIPPAIMEHLFEPFHTTKPVGSGTGLGLSIVYGAVKQAGGLITAASAEGAGTTFDIYLPRCLEEPTDSVAPSPLPVNVRGGTVLVAEDEPVVRAVARTLLSRSGYTVLTAPDGASALNVLRDHPVGIGLILLDMTMPGMTSSEVVQSIRALDPTVPILLNSGYTSNSTVKQMLDDGSVQGFLGKPYDLDQLLENVQRLLHRG